MRPVSRAPRPAPAEALQRSLRPSRRAPADAPRREQALGNQAAARFLGAAAVQCKLKVSAPGDALEREADRVADAVMAGGTAPRTSAIAAGPSPPTVQRMCDGCKEEEETHVRRKARPEATTPAVPSPPLLSGAGHPMSGGLRSRFEAGFGRDLGAVRLHTGTEANAAARAFGARAFTLGSDIVFGAGEYAPGTREGQHLMAHELTHVAQQSGGGETMIQRLCGRAAERAMPQDCNLRSVPIPAERFLFDVNCDTFAAGEEARLQAFAHAISPTAAVDVVGLASADGRRSLNEALSCLRAAAGDRVLRGEGVVPSSVAATGPVGVPGDTTLRAVGVELVEPVVEVPKCGPDVTDWLVRQAAAAVTDPDVLDIQRDIAAADTLARADGTTAQEIAEGGAATAVAAQQMRMGSSAPPLNPTITGQLATGTASGAAAATALSSHPFDALRIGRLLARASLNWRALVNHGAPFDFKAHVLLCPSTATCADPACACSVTLCPGSTFNMCFTNEVPGNLFYALIGRFVGWSELTLQLGSQLAQLTGTGTWDTPDDTEAIRVGFALPLPLSAAALCAAVEPVRLSLDFRTGCRNCTDPVVISPRAHVVA